MTAQYPANLDRCRRCGAPRKMHGNDGGCGLTFPAGTKFAALFVTAGAVLGGAIWLLASSARITVSSLAAFACLVILIVLVSGAAVVTRRR